MSFGIKEDGALRTCWYSRHNCQTCGLPMATDGQRFWCSMGKCKDETIQTVKNEKESGRQP